MFWAVGGVGGGVRMAEVSARGGLGLGGGM